MYDCIPRRGSTEVQREELPADSDTLKHLPTTPRLLIKSRSRRATFSTSSPPIKIKRVRRSSGGGGAAGAGAGRGATAPAKGGSAPNCCTRSADGGCYGGGKDSFSLCFYCHKSGELSCCSRCPVTCCLAKAECVGEFEKHVAGAKLTAESIFLCLRKQTVFLFTPHGHIGPGHELTKSDAALTAPRYCDVCDVSTETRPWHCAKCGHDECESCHARRNLGKNL